MSHTILLVEDNPDDEVLTLRAFKKSGVQHDIVVARDGAEALAAVFGPGGERVGGPLALAPAVVLLDLKLPRIDGLEVLRRLRRDERTRVLPVVVLTSSSQDQDIDECYRAGANSYVRKPVDYVEFVETARRIGLYWLLLNERAGAP